MDVRTTRFGTIQIAEDRVITFPKGLLGFPGARRYCLLEPGEEACFFWLQSLDDPALAFVVTDPALFVPDYSVPIRPEQMADLGLPRLEDAQVFVIVNKVDSQLTGNLQGPLVINTLSRAGEQMVLAEKRWTTRHPLMRVGEPARAATA
ncbi:MAG: flagellar assembly protein FliW [Phycisphaerales bacterium]